MKLLNVFKSKYGHLRAGWRILIWLSFVLVCFIPVAGILKIWDLLSPKMGETDYSAQFNSPEMIVFYLGLSAALILGSWLTLNKIDKRPYALLGFDFKWSALGDYFSGFVLALLNFIPIILIMLISDLIDITFSSISILTLKNLLIYFIAFNVAAIFEELFPGLFISSLDGRLRTMARYWYYFSSICSRTCNEPGI